MRFTKEDILGHMERLSNDPDFDPEFSQLMDFRQITAVEIGPEDVREFAAKNTSFRPVRGALCW